MIKSGSTAWQIIKPGVDLGLIDSIIITYKTLPGYGSRVLFQKRYPDDTRVNGDELLLPLSQADTTLLREEGGDRVRLELQYNYSSGAVAKSEIQTVHIGDTLATAFVDGSNPDEAQIEGLPIEFAAGDAIVIESENKCVKDWNENDPESEKYIEGRTHYKKPTYPSDAPMIETLTAGATLLYDFTGLSATYINRILYENATDPDGQYPFEWNWEAKLSTGWMASENTSAGNYYAEKIDDANFRIMGNKKYDFYLYFISDPALLTPEYANRFPKKGVYVTVNDSGTDNIRNFKAGFVVVAQLKRNYIPDSIARTADVVSRQQLAADAGKALVIGEDGVVKAGEVGGGGSLVAEIFLGDFGYITSHTSQEIYAAHTAGKTIQAHVFGRYVPCVNVLEGFAEFVGTDIEGAHIRKLRATISDNEADVQYIDYTPPVTSVNGQTGDVEVGGGLIVTITENDDGTFTPSHTSQEIYAAYMGGKSVTAIVNSNTDTIYNLRACFDGYACFEYVYAHEDGAQGNVGFDIEGDNATYYENHYESSPMTPATAEADGLPGLVPAPAAGQQDMVLHGDGTWRAVEGGGGGSGGGVSDESAYAWKKIGEVTLTGKQLPITAVSNGVVTIDETDGAIKNGKSYVVHPADYSSDSTNWRFTATDTAGQYTVTNLDGGVVTPAASYVGWVIDILDAESAEIIIDGTYDFLKLRATTPTFAAHGARMTWNVNGYPTLSVSTVNVSNGAPTEYVAETSECPLAGYMYSSQTSRSGRNNGGQNIRYQRRVTELIDVPSSISIVHYNSLMTIGTKFELWGR